MTTFSRVAKPCAAFLLVIMFLSAQAQFFGGRGSRRGFQMRGELAREQEEMQKSIAPAFKEDVFTFARLKFGGDRGFRYGRGRGWDDDSPSADYGISYRLFQVTSLKVRPDVSYVDITTKDLANYPFVYVASAGWLDLTDEEVTALHNYLLNGGFLMVDDFWGDDQWDHFYEQIKRVFPDREPTELTLDHRIFHTVFDFKKEPQSPSVGAFLETRQTYDPGYRYARKDSSPHYYGIFDDQQRMMVIVCHNNHFGDGWEHETEDESYFDEVSEPSAYPMFINILVYAMTH